jgi:hypothetical protein
MLSVSTDKSKLDVPFIQSRKTFMDCRKEQGVQTTIDVRLAWNLFR